MNFLTGLLGIHILFNLCASFTPLSMSKNENTRYNASVKSALARSLSKDDIETNAPDGMYKIACFYYGGEYHFYRQNSDGFWSHKNYHDPVSNLDFSGNTIIDPLLSDRSFYDNLLGYFAIRPVLR